MRPVFSIFSILIFLLVVILGCKEPVVPITKIAFGSCGHEDHQLPIFDIVVKHNPDLFIFLGDNIYGDTDNMDTLRAKYGRLTSKPTFQNLKQNVPIIATWDDHDFGRNDAGRNYPYKEEAKRIFMDVFEEPEHSERRKRPGIYTSYYHKIDEHNLQIILLDTRTFRDDLKTYNGEVDSDQRYFYDLDYTPHTDTLSTFLGAKQWAWLRSELLKPADLRIIGSSTQFSIEYNGYEAWTNFPHEQKRLLNLIKETKANGVLFISGDVHYAEISKLSEPDLYPIYDITASGLSSKWYFATPNRNRIEGPIMDNHFGMLTIQWHNPNPKIIMEIWDDRDNQRIEYTIGLDEINF